MSARVLRAAVAGMTAWTAFACADTPTDLVNTMPSALIVVSGDEQSGVVGTELAQPIVVRVVNSEQQPLPNQIINFRVIQGGGSVFAGAAITNAQGIAQERWTLGTSVADSQIVEARAVDNSTGAALVFGRFVSTPLPGAPQTLEIISGNSQSANVSSALPQPLVVRVRDIHGNVVPGATVAWNILTGAGALSASSSVANASGEASISWTLGSAAGQQLSEARVGAAVAEFTAAATPEQISLAIVAGNDQVAPPGTAVPVAPAVRAVDAGGNPKSGVTITFGITQGGGSVAPASVTSDAQGIAVVSSWTLGVAGTNTLAATSPSGSTVTFVATASAGGTGIAVHEGNNQVAVTGANVAISPAVRVTNGAGTVQPGASVTFEVGAGGGSITGATATSDGSGIARVGSWTLGSSSGTNTLVARLSSGASTTFTAHAVRRSADITVSITSPSTALIGDTILIRASVSSTNQLTSVNAHIGGNVIPLSAAQPGVMQGTAVITSLPRDTVTLLVRATDVNGAVTEAVRLYTHDRAPRLIITSPQDRAAVYPALRVTAACDDDDDVSGCLITVYNAGQIVAGPAPSVDQTLTPPTSDVHSVLLEFRARDSRNQTAYTSRRAFVVPSGTMQHIATMDGEAVDLLGNRILTSRVAGADTLAIAANFETGARDTIRHSGSLYSGALTSNGAAFSVHLTTAPYSRIYIHRTGVPLFTRTTNSASSLAAEGSYVIYTVGAGVSAGYRYNTALGVEEQIAAASGNTENDVAANGDVAYWAGYNIYRYRNGTTTAVTTDASTKWNTYPLTDGVNVVFRRHTPCCSPPVSSELMLWTGEGAPIVLAPHPREVFPGRDYHVSGGWTAFTQRDVTGYDQVWTRSPAGVLRQVSTLGSSSVIAALGSDGSVVFDNGTNRYHAAPTTAAVRINSTLGVVRWRDNRFVTLIGGSAFAITP